MSFQELDLSILKTIVTDKNNALDFVNKYDSKLFSPELWNAANLIINFIKTFKTTPTLRVLTDKLSKSGNENLVNHIKQVWEEIDKLNYDNKEYKYDLEKLKTRYAEKQIINIKENLSKIDVGSLDITKTMSEMQKAVQNIKNVNQAQTFSKKTLKESMEVFKEEYNARIKNPEFDSGVMTNYKAFDDMTGGLRDGELLLIGGESSAGKSMLLMNMAIQIWLQNNNINMTSDFTKGYDVLYFSLEMPFKPCLNRVLSRLAHCPSKLLKKSKLEGEDVKNLKKAMTFINNYPYEFEIIDMPRGATIENMEAVYEECKARFDPKIVVIDYLGLMDYNGKEMDDWLKLGYISAACHEFSRVHNCIVLSAVQLNRIKATKEAEEKIGMHRIGRSALIMQNANIGIQIETRQNEKLNNDVICHLIKVRDGELGKIRLLKDFACSSILDDPEFSAEGVVPEFYDVDDISEQMELLD